MATTNIKTGTLQNLPVDKIELDRMNPRVRRFVEIFGDDVSAERMYLALGAASGNDSDSITSFEKLKNSILTNGGIIQPIIVNRRIDGTLVCIEGNMRVGIYKKFVAEKVPGNWSQISALVYDDMAETQIHAIRMQVHLVETCPWDAYSKAKYLNYLSNEQGLPFNVVVDFCGGRKKDLIESMQAFSDMEAYYRDVAGDDGFDSTQFSSFVELQKAGIKQAIHESGYTLTDFSKWVHDEKLYPLTTVRSAPPDSQECHGNESFLEKGRNRSHTDT